MAKTSLKEVIAENILYGDFVTSDFKSTRYFIYLENIITNQEFITLLIEEMEKKKILNGISVIAGLSWESSSLLLAKTIAEKRNKKFTIIDYPISPPLKTELMIKNIRGYLPNDSDHVLVVCCIISSGDSLLRGCDVISQIGAKPIGFTIVNRNGESFKELNKAGIKAETLFKWNQFEESKKETEEIDTEFIKNQLVRIKGIFDIQTEESISEQQPETVEGDNTDFNGFINSQIDIFEKILVACKTVNLSEISLKKWLLQFENNKEREIALKLLEHIEIYDDARIRKKFREIHQYLEEKMGKKTLEKHTSFIPLGPPGKSGARSIYLYRTREHGVLDIEIDSAHALLSSDGFIKNDCLIFIDDFIGVEGTQAIRYIEDFFKIPSYLEKTGLINSQVREELDNFLNSVDKYYIAVVGFVSGVKAIEKKTGIKCKVGDMLSDENKAFTVGNIFLSETEANEAEKIVDEIGRKIYKEGPLGWSSNEALIVFSYNTPTNTLPIFWSYGEGDFKWFPLFPRYDVVKKEILESKENDMEQPNIERHASINDAKFVNTQFESFSEKEIKDINENMPLLNYFKEKIKTKPFSNKRFFIILHFLKDLIPFMEACEKLGLKPSNAICFFKKYKYPHREKISAHLQKRGYQIHPLESLADVLITYKEKEINDEILIIEDGGYIAPKMHEEFLNILSNVIGCVEQTTKGIREDKKIQDIGFPILSLPHSKLKQKYEPPYVADAVINNIHMMFPDVNFKGKNVLIIGGGTIGEEIAIRLKSDMNAVVYDTNPDVLVGLSSRVNIVRNLMDGIKNKELIIGATGETSIGKHELLSVEHNAYLVSASSDQKEIGLDELEALSQEKEEIILNDRKKIGTAYHLRTTQRKINLIADGYPINFWASESMPNQASDLILTLIFLSAVEICENHSEMSNNIDEEKINEIAKKYELSDLYLSIHHKS
jgi:S-adenosylhomocysteine hydrolase